MEASPEGIHSEGTTERAYALGRVAASLTAPLPAGFQPLGVQGSAPTEDVSVIRTTSGPHNPGWLEASPEGMHSEGMPERTYALGRGATSATASLPVDFQPSEALGGAPAEDGRASHVLVGPDGLSEARSSVAYLATPSVRAP